MIPRPSPEDPDLPLIRAIGTGDTHALRELYDRHGAGLLSFLIDRLHDRQWAEEVLQDVMLAVWKAAAAFRGECKVRTWLLAIARRHVIDACYRHQLPCVAFDDGAAADTISVPAMVERHLLYEKLGEVFSQLPADQREVVKLVFYHGLTCAEAAGLVGVPVGTVKSRLYHARQTMRRLLQIEDIHHA
ncbi:MAG: sigma-70 family RNA polymerase sigma factor [Chloroflexi bacterium]|nr:sigma-70 family RNA polymerase sigma factor [Chloroflexota bacterium]